MWCRERDSNPHAQNEQKILSLPCLPFQHRGIPAICIANKLFVRICNAKVHILY